MMPALLFYTSKRVQGHLHTHNFSLVGGLHIVGSVMCKADEWVQEIFQDEHHEIQYTQSLETEHNYHSNHSNMYRAITPLTLGCRS